MNDYLRARIEALEKEVDKQSKKIAFLEAKLEVSKEFGFNYYKSNTLTNETR